MPRSKQTNKLSNNSNNNNNNNDDDDDDDDFINTNLRCC
jgi:hypothetical protein